MIQIQLILLLVLSATINGQTQYNIWSFEHTHNMCHMTSERGSNCAMVDYVRAIHNYVDDIPSIVPTLKPLVDNVEGRTNYIPTSLPSQASKIPSIVPTLKPYIDGVETNTNKIPSMQYQLGYSSSSYPTGTPHGNKATIRYEVDKIYNNYVPKDTYTIDIREIKNSIFEMELLLANINNITLIDLSDTLDHIKTRVQLRPTSAPTLIPTTSPSNAPTRTTDEPSLSPTSDPTTSPTASTDDPTTNPTNYPSTSPTKSTDGPTGSPTNNPTNEPSIDPTPAPTMTWSDPLVITNGAVDASGATADEFNTDYYTYHEYHIIRRECPECSTDYKTLYYRRTGEFDQFDPADTMISWNYGNDIKHEVGWDFEIYSTIQDALKNENKWYGCRDHNSDDDGSISAFGECKRNRDGAYKSCQYSSAHDPDCSKDVSFSVFVGDVEYVGVDLDDVDEIDDATQSDPAAKSINLNDLPGIENDYYGAVKGDGNFQIIINAKEFDLALILTMLVLISGLNIVFWKYGCCGLGKGLNYKYKPVQFEDSEVDCNSEAVAMNNK